MPSTPKSDTKPAVEEPQKKAVNNVEKVAENNAEENKVVQEKIAVFDELGGNFAFNVTLRLREKRRSPQVNKHLELINIS